MAMETLAVATVMGAAGAAMETLAAATVMPAVTAGHGNQHKTRGSLLRRQRGSLRLSWLVTP